MKTISTVAAVSVLASLAGSANAAIVFLGSFGGFDYYRNDTPQTYLNSRATALLPSGSYPGGGFLTSINSLAEKNFILGVVPFNLGVHWIGFSAEGSADPANNPVYKWDDGSPVTYTNWGGGNPVLGNAARIYASLNWNGGGEWSNLENTGSPFGLKPSIYKVIPSPGAAAALGLAGLLAFRRRRA
ncbi:MAG: C-type lectin domain-containing protein [Phycisphaerales bacterium]|nr:C-type lectin domain-containing protein [Phycisphaerales bacterium]